MIFLYSGTPGSGKSLHTARIIYNSLKYTDELVITNFPVNEKKIGKIRGKLICSDNETITPDFLKWLSLWWFSSHKFKEGKILLILDESQLLFNSRDWNMNGRAGWLAFFTGHRHYGYDVILAAQFDRMLDRQIRSIIEYEYIHRKVSNFGWRGKLLSAFAFGKLFCCVKTWYPMRGEQIGFEYYKCHKKYYSLYDTHMTFDSFEKLEST